MKRKVNMVGTGTLTISLPSKWVKDNGIKKGDEVELGEEGSKLIISSEALAETKKTVTLNIDGFNKLMLNRFFQEFYRSGVEEIIINFSKENIHDNKNKKDIAVSDYIKKIIERFIGMEIISKTRNRIIIQTLISREEYANSDVVLNRIYFLIKEFLEEFLFSLDKDFEKFYNSIYDYHDNINKFTYYYLRLINFSDYSEEKKSQLFGFFTVIDKIIDKLRHTGERVHEIKSVSKNLKKYLQEIFGLFTSQFDMIFKSKFTINEIDQLIKKRYDLVKRVESEKFTYDELRVICECKIMLDTINDFLETYVTLNRELFVSYS